MSENSPENDKTEKPTEKRISDARLNGDVPMSTEVSIAAGIITILTILMLVWPMLSNLVVSSLVGMLDRVGERAIANDVFRDTISIQHVLYSLSLPIIAIAMLTASGIAAIVSQIGLHIIGARVSYDPSRISPMQNARRMLGAQHIIQLSKNLLKLSVAGCVVLNETVFQAQGEHGLLISQPSAMSQQTIEHVQRICSAIAVLMLISASIDWALSKIMWLRKLRMSRNEVRDETRRSEGDHELKARFRSIRRARGRARMLASVARATMVVVNPTHYAVAMRYVRDETVAPVVVAKGRDLIALKIRERATDLAIAVIENKELARALYGACNLDHAIPSEFYRAVAGIINVIQRPAAFDRTSKP